MYICNVFGEVRIHKPLWWSAIFFVAQKRSRSCRGNFIMEGYCILFSHGKFVSDLFFFLPFRIIVKLNALNVMRPICGSISAWFPHTAILYRMLKAPPLLSFYWHLVWIASSNSQRPHWKIFGVNWWEIRSLQKLLLSLLIELHGWRRRKILKVMKCRPLQLLMNGTEDWVRFTQNIMLLY